MSASVVCIDVLVSGTLTVIQGCVCAAQVKLVSIDAADVADGHSSIILGLIWNIILFFQVVVYLPFMYCFLFYFTFCNYCTSSSVHDFFLSRNELLLLKHKSSLDTMLRSFMRSFISLCHFFSGPSEAT